MAEKKGKKRVTFRFHAPDARRVHIAGSFNGWDPDSRPLKKYDDGFWKGTISLEPGLYEYRFVRDGIWHEDPASEERLANQFGGFNSVVKV
jgi:1,4-alpha-glucan branching enzyme